MFRRARRRRNSDGCGPFQGGSAMNTVRAVVGIVSVWAIGLCLPAPGASAQTLFGATFRGQRHERALRDRSHHRGRHAGGARSRSSRGSAIWRFIPRPVDQAGKQTPLLAAKLGGAIVENRWYRVTMDIGVGAGFVSVLGAVLRHEDELGSGRRRDHLRLVFVLEPTSPNGAGRRRRDLSEEPWPIACRSWKWGSCSPVSTT
jgi:hypothetical protein